MTVYWGPVTIYLVIAYCRSSLISGSSFSLPVHCSTGLARSTASNPRHVHRHSNFRTMLFESANVDILVPTF